MNNIQIFQNEQFGKVRIAMNESNEPLFCLADVCGVIGIANARNVRSRLEEDDVRQMDTIDSLGRNQQVTFITESGLYDVIIRSDSEKAKPFRKWVTSEVLPSIRKHGAYMTSDTLEKALTSPDFLIQLAINLKEEKQKRIEAEQKIQKDAPKVLFGGYWWLAKSCPLLSLLIVLNQHFIKSCTMRQNFDGTKMGQNRRKIKPRPLCSEYPYQNTLILNTKVQICPVINEPMSLFLSSITHFSIILYHGRFFKVLDTLFHILQLNNVFLIVVQCSERLPIIETAHLYTPFVRLDSDFSVVMKCVALFPSMANCHLKVSHKDVVNCMLNQ